LRPPVGGDFAGLSATFDVDDGSLIEIPHHLIPESLLEWGQVPWALEVLVSEDQPKPNVGPSGRQTVTISPETGCGIDNLDTQKLDEQFPESAVLAYAEMTDIGAMGRLIDGGSDQKPIIFEAIFATTEVDDDNDLPHRVRVQVPVNKLSKDIRSSSSSSLLSSPVRIYRERQIDTASSRGTSADGGGLDGRTVSRKLGQHIRKFQSKMPEPQVKAKDADTAESSDSGVHFPFNISIATNVDGEEGLAVVRVGHDGSVEESQDPSHGRRVVVVKASVPLISSGDESPEGFQVDKFAVEVWAEEHI